MSKENKTEKELENKLQAAKNVSLSEGERERMRNFLYSYMEHTPVRGERAAHTSSRSWFALVSLRLVPALVVVLFFVSGGFVMAQNALPGDPLYVLKTAQEEMRNQLSFSTESKARLDAARVERRLSEASELAFSDSLTPKTSEQLKTKIDTRIRSIEKKIAALEEQNDAITALEIGSEYESILRVYRDLLARLSEGNSEMAGLVASLTDMDYEKETTESLSVSEPPETEGALSLESEEPPKELADDGSEGGSSSAEAGGEVGIMAEEEVSVSVDVNEEDSEEDQLQENNKDEAKELRIETENIEEKDNLTINTLELFVSTRLEKTEVLLEKKEVGNSELKERLSEHLEQAKRDYENGKKASENDSEEEAREYFKTSLGRIEDVRTTLRISESIPAQSILESLKKETSANAFDALEGIIKGFRSEKGDEEDGEGEEETEEAKNNDEGSKEAEEEEGNKSEKEEQNDKESSEEGDLEKEIEGAVEVEVAD
ncbi:MAG: DUF5667 domain-containing protein [Candidatus Campbellbacteria bacterium]|nr:DUF5667 domain-containing protein [Candidatus Campbellbacteria bacterium]